MSGRHETTGRLERTVGFALRLGVRVSAVCLGAGLMLGLAHVGPDASHFLLQVGILVLLATPIARVAVSIAGYLAERDWLFVTLTTIVLVELAASVVAALVFNRRL